MGTNKERKEEKDRMMMKRRRQSRRNQSPKVRITRCQVPTLMLVKSPSARINDQHDCMY